MLGWTTVRFAGFGGQGIVRAGEIFGAAALCDGKAALQNQSYGSSARGGLCTSDVAVGAGPIHEIEPDEFDVLVVLSQDSCDAYLGLLRPGGILVHEQELVSVPSRSDVRALGVPATHVAATELGRKIVMNMVALGFCGAVTQLVGRHAIEETIRTHGPRGTAELNLRAFAEGWRRGEKADAGA
jgi:2-oxoglutarate ferredoxin oxidoreductase subunit gamma